MFAKFNQLVLCSNFIIDSLLGFFKVRWRPVVWGTCIQFLIGILVLRWPVGLEALSWLSDQIVHFLDYTQKGTVFVYGFLVEPPNICGAPMHPVFVFSVGNGLYSILFCVHLMQSVVGVANHYIFRQCGCSSVLLWCYAIRFVQNGVVNANYHGHDWCGIS